MTKERRPWRFTKSRQNSLIKARRVHSELVKLGEEVRRKRRTGK